MRKRRLALVGAWVAGALLLLVGIGVFVVTMTDFGRERVRLFSVERLAERIHGDVEVGRIQGNLLSGATLEDVTITDAEGRPFLRADTLSFRYSMRSLFQKHLVFTGLRLVRPVVVLDQPPGGEWNVTRIFQGDSVAVPGDTLPGFGDWVRIEDLEVVDGTVTVRRPWSPADTTGPGPGEGEDEAVAVAPATREMIASVPGGGYQSISSFHRVNGRFPLLRLADPDSATRVVVIDSLSTLAMPFRPPAARVRNLEGRLTVTGQTLGFHDVTVTLPHSRLTIDGTYALGGPESVSVRLRAHPVSLADLRWLRPSLPDGRGSFELAVGREEGQTRLVAQDVDLRVEGGRLRGHADAALGEEGVRLARSDLRFESLDTRTVERLAGTSLPVEGVLAGRVRLAGTTEELDVDGWATVRERGGATSRIEADGVVENGPGEIVARNLELRFDPLRTTLARSLAPDLSLAGTVTGRATLDGPLGGAFTVDADLAHRSPGGATSRIAARGGLRVTGGVEARDLRLRFDPLRPELLRAFAPDLPLEGVVTGRATVDGALASTVQVDAELVHRGPDTGTSRVAARGAVRLAGGVEARDLQVRLEPLSTDLLRAFQPDFPLEGTLEGRATVSGSPSSRLTATALDLTHRGPAGASEVSGEVSLDLAPAEPVFDLDVRVEPLTLATLDPLVPGAGLRGSVSGRIAAEGTLESATLDADLRVADGGTVAARGTVGVGPRARYDLRATFGAFDASAVAAAPPTALTGSIAVQGVGTEPATASATVDARLVDSRVEGVPGADSTRVLARLDEGLVTFERGHVRLGGLTADVTGSFGLVAGRSGELRYTLTADSLARFSALAPADTGTVTPRPLPRALEVAEARADSARTARDRLVESLATGGEMTPPVLDTAPPLPRDSVAGNVRAEGVLTGNLESFGARGVAILEDVVLRGNRLGTGRLEYTAENVPSPEMDLAVQGNLEGVRAGGFVFDRASLDVTHRGGLKEGSGRAELAVTQDPARDYGLTAEYDLELDRRELRLEEVALRFDTTRWTSTRTGVVRWAGRGVEVEHIELTSDRGGRIFVDGALLDGVPGRLRIDVDSLPLGHLAGLVQDTLVTHGLLSLDATVTGTLAAPVAEGSLVVDSLRRAGHAIPTLRAAFDYAGGQLTAQTEVLGEGRTLLEGEVRLPVDLALTGREGPRITSEATVSADLRLDSLPLEALSGFTDVVTDVRGRLAGDVVVEGTLGAPEVRGELTLDLVSARIPEPNLVLRDGRGRFTLLGDRVTVDSLVATSDGGPIRVTGGVGLESLTRPELDLHVTAEDALLLDNDQGVVRADLDLAVAGPFTTPEVTGSVRVQSAEIQVPQPDRYRRVTDLSDPVLVGALDTLGVRPALRPAVPFFQRVRMDVTVRVDRDTWLRNTDLSVEVYTPADQPPLRVTSDPEQRTLSLTGVVNTDRGHYVLAGRELELNSGSVTFLGGPQPDPLLQLNAQHEVPRRGQETLLVLVNVGGRLSAPRISLSSNAEPPLPESDLISLLAFGQATSSLMGSEGSGLMGGTLGGLGVLAGQQAAGLGLGALTDAFISGLEREGTETGIDVFRVRPGAIPDELNYSQYFGNLIRGAEIEAGEYIGERLFVVARTRTTGQLVPGLRLEYRTPAGLSWMTTWEEQYLPSRPTLGLADPSRSRVFGSFLLWTRRF